MEWDVLDEYINKKGIVVPFPETIALKIESILAYSETCDELADTLQAKLDIAVEALEFVDDLYEIGTVKVALNKIKGDTPSKVYPVGDIEIYHGFGWGGNHTGVDWVVPVGTTVECVKDGKVVETAEDSKTYGRYCLILHDDVYASLYAHLSKLNVKRGDTVKAGDVVGLSGGVPGTPGAGASKGYHLHFEIRPPGHIENNFHNIDPITYLKGE